MTNAHPTLPLIREAPAPRSYHHLLEGRANTDLFGGWGVSILSTRVW